MNKEGGDMDEAIERVRAKTMAMREKVIEEYKKGTLPLDDDGNDEEEDGSMKAK
jgi:hypothetical protein